MKNTIKRDKLGAVIAPTTKEENIFWANRKEIMAKSKAEGRDLDATASKWAHENGIQVGSTPKSDTNIMAIAVGDDIPNDIMLQLRGVEGIIDVKLINCEG